MLDYRDLDIYCEDQTFPELVHLIEAKLSNGWFRDIGEEERLKPVITSKFLYCFSCDATDTRKAALLSLMQRARGNFYVPNVVPREIGHLSYQDYNAILEEFYYLFVQPAAKESGAELVLSSNEKSLEDWLSKDAILALKRFSKGANKSTGSAHPSDNERWISFLISAHSEKSPLTPTDLGRWLVEDEAWPEDVVNDLLVEYEFSRELLRAYEKRNS